MSTELDAVIERAARLLRPIYRGKPVSVHLSVNDDFTFDGESFSRKMGTLVTRLPDWSHAEKLEVVRAIPKVADKMKEEVQEELLRAEEAKREALNLNQYLDALKTDLKIKEEPLKRGD
jgi:hypothetical protein